MEPKMYQAEIRFPSHLRELFIELLQLGADTLALEYYLSEHQEELLSFVGSFLDKEKRQIRRARKSGAEILPSHISAKDGIKITRASQLGTRVMAAVQELDEADLELNTIKSLRDIAQWVDSLGEAERRFFLTLADVLEGEVVGKS